MNHLTKVNLRGKRISPERKKELIHHYLCVIDQPDYNPLQTGNFTVKQPSDGDETLEFTYNGTLVEPAEGDTLVTYMLPLYKYQNIKQPNGDNLKVVVTDTSSTPNRATGNPNKGRPPVVQPVERGDLSPSLAVFKSDTPGTDNYFVLAVVSTYINTDGVNQAGGYSNQYDLSYNLELSDNLTGILQPSEGNGTVAAMGAIASLANEFAAVQIQAGDYSGPQIPIDYSTYDPI